MLTYYDIEIVPATLRRSWKKSQKRA